MIDTSARISSSRKWSEAKYSLDLCRGDWILLARWLAADKQARMKKRAEVERNIAAAFNPGERLQNMTTCPKII
ncbi:MULTISPECIES: hypothetical protein [Ochrobactrum]|uniref:hypothetical protein n=1 Tax=Ochrobactrum TaxID=528 RepID=UPI0017875B14|nr:MULTISPECIES: hypothetical protein [Brucella/Ochrobactrum group]MBD7992110.1 hypothetical protein [Ochrobactrum gallinarum]MDH7793384.1 hypothetical protein [Ochrobactrum sp. AN78]